MLSLTRMSAVNAKATNRFAVGRITHAHSSTATQTQVSRKLDTRNSRVQHRISVGSQYKLNRLDHLREVLDQHRPELQKFFDMRESPQVALMLPQTSNFPTTEKATEKKGDINAPNPQNKPQTKKSSAKAKMEVMNKLQNRQQNQASYAAQRRIIIATLRCHVDVSEHAGQNELGLQALNYYRWYLRKLHQRLSCEPPEPFPVDIYNTILSGCATRGEFEVASEVKQLMSWDNINPDASSYAYLLAAAKGKADILGVIKSMSAANITLEDLFVKTALTEDQLEKLLVNIRKSDNNQDFEIPAFAFRQNQTCDLIADLKDARQPFHGKPTIDLEHMRKQTIEQKNRELAGIIKVKSIAAAKEPSARVVFLRQQVARCENEWREALSEIFDSRLEAATNQALHLHEMSVYPYLLVLDKSIFIELLVQEMRMHALSSESFSMGFSWLACQLGRKVEQLYHIQSKVKRGVLNSQDQIYDEYLKVFDPRHTTPTRELWQAVIAQNSHFRPTFENHRSCPWPSATSSSVGSFLYSFLRQVKVNVNILQPNCGRREMMNALFSVYRSTADRTKEELKVHRVLTTLYTKAELEDLHFDSTQVPMLCPPKPWCHAKGTPFLLSPATLIRVSEDSGQQQMNAIDSLPAETMYPSLDALNVLSRTPWKVNKAVLDTVTAVFLGDGDKKLAIPKHPDKIPPPNFTALKEMPRAAARAENLTFRREKAETYSQWCDMLYKLSIAHHFKDDIFFFPHNMDFRGRVYPVPPHFQHLGGDTVRGLLLFGEGKPLGKSGLWWLKLHLINLTGFKKKVNVKARVAYADSILDDIIDSAKNPLTGRKWWQDSDDPWQTLATCIEISNALESPDPEQYICHLPIHQDGSCNGLQHYAALGRDYEGAKQVNLVPMDEPQDVYMGIAEVVEEQRKADSLDGVEIASALEGHITRKVVKQTVMTVVYGVTRFGAYNQIHRQLENREFPWKLTSAASKYLVEKTFISLEKMFQKSRLIQRWFAECANKIITETGRPVRWTTPLGLPVVQPYFKRQSPRSLVRSEVSYRPLSVATSIPCKIKQKNGFPPNFVHSLDSAHMMLTAMYAEASGINFVSVHDCYWTHVSTVDVMNKICRQQFVALHSQPILENLAKEFEKTYLKPIESEGKKVPADLQGVVRSVPHKGKFKLRDVMKSTYFFS